jgi:two-component system phosphate regulon response regulator PhoB
MSRQNIKPSVLIVEDDSAIVTLLEYNLEKAGYNVRTTDDGEEALILIEESKPDLILLDWMLPGMSGIQICNRLRRNEETKRIPIIMLSARGEESDRVEGLESGVDDYLVKPFSPRELIARINAVFRRMRPAFSETELVYGGIRMDLAGKRAYYNSEEMKLGPIEYRLLQSLMEHPKRVLSRDQLIRRVWGYSLHVEPRTVDVHINRLRKALQVEKNGALIRTIRSSGYCLTEHDDNILEPILVNDSEITEAIDDFDID